MKKTLLLLLFLFSVSGQGMANDSVDEFQLGESLTAKYTAYIKTVSDTLTIVSVDTEEVVYQEKLFQEDDHDTNEFYDFVWSSRSDKDFLLILLKAGQGNNIFCFYKNLKLQNCMENVNVNGEKEAVYYSSNFEFDGENLNFVVDYPGEAFSASYTGDTSGDFVVESLLFLDLSSSNSLYSQVMQAVEEGWISGYPDQTIRLENTVNRAEFAKMLTLAFGKSANPEEPHIVKFPDLEKNAWYRGFLAKAVELGVMSGYPDGTMKPAQTINAAEASKMVLEIAGTDIAETEVWYEGYRQELLKLEEPPSYITNGEMDYLITRGDAIDLILKVKN